MSMGGGPLEDTVLAGNSCNHGNPVSKIHQTTWSN